ncbi:MAG: flippase-like domain-containing protein, partial [Candidatus Eisenbacteria bacterium]
MPRATAQLLTRGVWGALASRMPSRCAGADTILRSTMGAMLRRHRLTTHHRRGRAFMDDPPPPALAGTPATPPRKSPLGLILRLAVAAGCLALLLRIVHPRELIATLERASWPFFLASLAAYVCDESLSTLKWRQLLRGVADPPRFRSLLRLTLEGRFIAFFLPSTVTADLYKGAVLTRRGRSGAAAMSSIV